MQVNCAHSEMVDIDLLVPNPHNPNKHPEQQIKLLAKIMAHQGWRSPIVVSNRSGFIVKGHGRLAACKQNGWTSAPVDRQDYACEADEYADMVADNKIAELAETDMNMVTVDIGSLGPDFDLELLGILDFKVEEAELPELSSEDRGSLRQMAFQLTEAQVEELNRAIKISKSMGDFEDTGSSNSNGNAIARIAEIFVTQHGSSEGN